MDHLRSNSDDSEKRGPRVRGYAIILLETDHRETLSEPSDVLVSALQQVCVNIDRLLNDSMAHLC